eukprot:jgi/Hompol1/5653/HPOL_004616-RA
MTTTKALKVALRKQMRSVLKAVTQESIEQQSLLVTNKLLSSPEYIQSRKVAIFLNMPKGEINTVHILKDIFQTGRQAFVPFCTPEQMDMVLLKSWQDFVALPRNSWEIPEPPSLDGQTNALDESVGGLDLIVMPGMAFDREGNRMGYGKGYYDKFLERCFQLADQRGLPRPATVAISLREQLVDHVPTDTFDIKPGKVLSPE